jgi:hypothetical protein
MLVPACGDGRACEGGLERGGDGPSSEAEPARGGPWLGHSGGLWGPPRCGPCLGRVLKWEVFCFGFLQVLSRVPLVVLGDPQGCPRQYISENVLKSWWNRNFPLKPCRWLMILIAIGQELMGALRHTYKINQVHILLLGWWSGVETIANKPNTSLRS